MLFRSDATSFYHKMRKSLGSKRNEISEQDIAEISRIYGAFQVSDTCKIFDNKEFGYLKVTIERPLRLNFQISTERIENLYAESSFANLYDEEKAAELELEKEKGTIKKKDLQALEKLYEGKALQEAIIRRLQENVNDKVYKNRDAFEKSLKLIFRDMDLAANLLKSVLSALSERDETADYCYKGKNKESDSSLRDTETIPLSFDVAAFEVDPTKHIKKEHSNILDYVEREVKPHVPEFWIDHDKTKIGYEIPFTRYFYKYEPLRPFAEIMLEIDALEQEIQAEIRQVIG